MEWSTATPINPSSNPADSARRQSRLIVQETGVLIDGALEEVVPLGWLRANVVDIFVQLGHSSICLGSCERSDEWTVMPCDGPMWTVLKCLFSWYSCNIWNPQLVIVCHSCNHLISSGSSFLPIPHRTVCWRPYLWLIYPNISEFCIWHIPTDMWDSMAHNMD